MRFKHLQKRSIGKWLLNACLDWSVIVLFICLACIYHYWWLWILAWIIIGRQQHALAILGHDGAHRLICKNKTVNDLLSCGLAFYPIFVGMRAYRKFHFKHHAFLGTKSDPELQHKGWATPVYDLPTNKLRICWHFLTDLIGRGAIEIVRIIKDFQPISWKILIYWIIISIIFYKLNLLWVLLFWDFCLVTSYWAFFRIRILTEHQGTPDVHKLTISWWMRFFVPHNTWMHYEHHRHPSVPFWALGELRKLNKNNLIDVKKLYNILHSVKALSGEPLAEIESEFDRQRRLRKESLWMQISNFIEDVKSFILGICCCPLLLLIVLLERLGYMDKVWDFIDEIGYFVVEFNQSKNKIFFLKDYLTNIFDIILFDYIYEGIMQCSIPIFIILDVIDDDPSREEYWKQMRQHRISRY